MSTSNFKITVDQLKEKADKIANMFEQEPTADANDRVMIANYYVGAAIVERLEVLVAALNSITVSDKAGKTND